MLIAYGLKVNHLKSEPGDLSSGGPHVRIQIEGSRDGCVIHDDETFQSASVS